jgi:hypothetical protein
MAVTLHEPLNVVGLAIGRTGRAQNHIGLIVDREAAGLWVGHLRWHHLLAFEPPAAAFSDPATGYLWVNFGPAFERENLRAIAAVLGSIERRAPKVSYGLTWDGQAFETSGDVLPGEAGWGLTCATFILKVLLRAGFDLVDLNDWNDRPEDPAWRDKIVGWLGKTNPPIDSKYLEAVKKDKDAPRVRPEDIVAASGAKKIPAPLKAIEQESAIVATELRKRLPDPRHE